MPGTLALGLPGTELPCRHLEKWEKQLLPSLKEARACALSSAVSGARTEVGLDVGGETREKRGKGWKVRRKHNVGQEKCSWYYFHLPSGILQWSGGGVVPGGWGLPRRGGTISSGSCTWTGREQARMWASPAAAEQKQMNKLRAEWERGLFKENSPEGLKAIQNKLGKNLNRIGEGRSPFQNLLSENINQRKQQSTTQEPCGKREGVKRGGAGESAPAADRGAKHSSTRSAFLAQSLNCKCVSQHEAILSWQQYNREAYLRKAELLKIN